MPKELTELSLDEVSLVDAPANQHARVVLMKRAANQEEDDKMDILETLKALTQKVDKLAEPNDAPDKQEIADIRAQLTKLTDTATDEIASLRKQLDDATQSVETKKFRDGLPAAVTKVFDALDAKDQAEFMKTYDRQAEDPIAKALDTVTKQNEELAKQIDALKADRAAEAIRKSLGDLDGVVENFDDFVKSYTTLKSTDETAADTMLKAARTLAKQAKEGGLFKVLGRDGDGSASAVDKINKAAATIRKENPELTPEQAEAKALDENPGLYDEYIQAQEG